MRLFQVGPVDKLKINGFLYGIIILSITGGHFFMMGMGRQSEQIQMVILDIDSMMFLTS